MQLPALTTLLWIFSLQATANAQIWTSPDGFLSITPPVANKFEAIAPPPPPFLGLWISPDESMKFGVMRLQLPPAAKLNQNSMEQGLAEEIGGKVTRLPTRQVSGFAVWAMTGKSDTVEITQAIVRRNGALYKVMAATVGQPPDAQLVDRFINSLTIAAAHSEASDQAQPLSDPALPLSDQAPPEPIVAPDYHLLSKAIGGAAALLVIGLMAYLLLQRNRSTQQ